MGSELVRDQLPNEGDKESKPSPPFSYTDVFERHFPYYLAIGMSPTDYWQGDNRLVIAYREADKIKQKRMNYEKWLQGAYIYEALCDASPLLNGLSRQHRAYPYSKKPYDSQTAEVKKSPVELEKENMKLQMEKFGRMMRRVNAKFERKEGKKNGG